MFTASAMLVFFSIAAPATDSSDRATNGGVELALGAATSVFPSSHQHLWKALGRLSLGGRIYGRRWLVDALVDAGFSALPTVANDVIVSQRLASTGMLAGAGIRGGRRFVASAGPVVGWQYVFRTLRPRSGQRHDRTSQSFFGVRSGLSTRLELHDDRLDAFHPFLRLDALHVPLRVDGATYHDMQLLLSLGGAFDVR